MRKYMLILLSSIILVNLCGCSVSEISVHEETKTVTFYNGYATIDEWVPAYVGAEPMSMTINYISAEGYSKLNVSNDELCAFVVKLQCYHGDTLQEEIDDHKDKGDISKTEVVPDMDSEVERLKELLLKDGTYIIKDYEFLNDSYSFAIVSTMENLIRVFYDDDMRLDGWSCLVAIAHRPDLLDMSYEYGYTSGDWDSWYNESNNELRKKLLEENEHGIEMDVTVLTY